MNKKIILYVIIGVLLVGLVVLTFFPGIIYAVQDSGKTGTDLCSPKPGYTQESWNEHMSHHPAMYEECLT